MNFNRLLIKINRICAWALLAFMIIFLASGYAWTNRVIMPLRQAQYLHTELDIYLVFFFLAHALISTKFTLARWQIRHGLIVSTALLAIGIISFWMVLQVR